MNETKIEYLLKYLELLLKAQQEGCISYQEISATTRAIANELGLNLYKPLDSKRGISVTNEDGSGITIVENGSLTVTGKSIN